jgi:RNA polymerase sigma factor (sigma-70 family)
LHAVARVDRTELDIALAKIHTEKGAAVDSFYMRERPEGKLLDADRQAANKAHDHRARMKAAKRGSGRAPLSLQAVDPVTGRSPDPPSSALGPDAVLMREERARLLFECLDELGNPCKEIIELRYFGGLSYDEIGGELRVNAKTVSSRLSRCLDRLETLARDIFPDENRGENTLSAV